MVLSVVPSCNGRADGPQGKVWILFDEVVDEGVEISGDLCDQGTPRCLPEGGGEIMVSDKGGAMLSLPCPPSAYFQRRGGLLVASQS